MRIATNGRRQTRAAGFGLVELMIVVCIAILLSCLALPTVARARAQTHETLCIHNLQRIEHAKALWYAKVGRSPEERPRAEELMGFF